VGGAAWRRIVGRPRDVLARVSGQEPVGIQTASWDFSPHTLDVIREVGLLYGNSLMGDDDPYELNDASKPTVVVEFPQSGSMTILYVSICCVTRHCARTHHRPRWRRSFSQNSTAAMTSADRSC
jgi:hypothetical protein